ncbi:MAG: flagellar hook assembly protein FlgD [Hyphomicrobiaceae bacterium]|nr:flagellar hook assembly protein FlgD [Hyphomicrobiaceae bacterium]
MVEINPFSALSSLGQSSTDRVSIADDFDTFLSLLTTQLQNQNPLDPLDMNQFTQQLVQFTEVEQTVKQNENLEQLIQLSAANAVTNVVSFLGAEVTLSGKTAEFSDGNATWTYDIQGNANNVTFTVSNSNGVPVHTSGGSPGSGPGTFVWNGQTDTGANAPEGTYTLTISAVDGSGTAVNVVTESVGIVDGVDYSGNEPILTVGGREVRLDEIDAVRRPGTSS